jgi:mutator protein MutT
MAIIMKQKVVVAAFICVDNKVLLAKRAATKSIAPGKYHLPGGHIEYGEQPHEALEREIKEEPSIGIEVLEPIFTFSYTLNETHTTGIVFESRLLAEKGNLHRDECDTEECVWVSEEEPEKYITTEDHNYQAATVGFQRRKNLKTIL